MGPIDFLAVGLAAVAICFHVVSISIAAWRCRKIHGAARSSLDTPPVTILRPVRGVDFYDELTLGSTFRLDYPRYEVIFCCAHKNDPAVSLVRRLIAANPGIESRLLIGDERCSQNPKLNNLLKGWAAARYDLIAMADSNVLLPADYLQRLLETSKHDTGLVCSPPVGSHPAGAMAELECAFLNTYQARWQLAADWIGWGFAQGKSMLWRRSLLDAAGGLEALAAEAAEDAAATKLVRDRGLRVRLVDRPFEQPLGPRTFKDVWARQVRWARLRRATFALCFVPELLTGSVVPVAATMLAATSFGADPLQAALMLLFGWYGAEALLARLAGWQLTLFSPLAWIVRDLLLPAVWLSAWTSNDFNWRGNEMSASQPQPLGRLALAPETSDA